MLEGWFCKALANDQNGSNAEVQSDEEIIQNQGQELQEHDYKTEYQNLKKKLKFLLYENEFFQDSLKASQRRLLKVTRDRSYLLDRLLQYEKADCSSTESEDTESSDEEAIKTEGKKRKLEPGQNVMKTATKKKRVGAPKKQQMMQSTSILHHVIPGTGQEEGLTTEEVLHHLQSRQSLHEMIPSVPPPIVPTEMFSNEPSSESNEMIENLGEDCLDLFVRQE